MSNTSPTNVILTTKDLIDKIDFILESTAVVRSMLRKKCYPIPTGGIPAAYLLASRIEIEIVENPEDADFFFDDIIDSGETMRTWCDAYPGKPFYAIVDKEQYGNDWVVFPWERRTPPASNNEVIGSSVETIESNVTRIISYIGDDPKRGGLVETPHRFVKAINHWFSGYRIDPLSLLKTFEDGAEGADEMVIVKDIPFYSKCEHHIADIFGTATIAYIPNGKVVGLSKLNRVLDAFARRLQVQERLTNQVADCLMEGLSPKGVAVVIKARHMCMESRGVCQQGHYTITSALRGVMKDQPETRAEFMLLAK